ncbi:MAG: hypothetical protein OXF05_00505 [Hyphomicrobiales bacterium]|nr:hypothetical protein [Hyphomicrobiales bacterium]MCY4032719.1 hypothetical protein [Hyphomicrobiales bacterium]MCY4039355.1 hypothetical protein [Hyphomicrobiales bacterium]
MDKEELKKRFEKEMHQVYKNVTKIHHPPTYLLRLIDDNGGFAAAVILLEKSEPSQTFFTLWELNRLDLSVETLVLKEPWRQLFEQRHLDEAERRLKDLNYNPYKN